MELSLDLMKNLLLPVFFCAVVFASCERQATYDIVARPGTGSASVNYISNRSPLLAALYAESTVHAKAGKRENICLEQTTRYPFDETVRIVIREADRVTFPLYLRIPAWCAEATAKIIAAGGQTSTVTAPAGQYLRISAFPVIR